VQGGAGSINGVVYIRADGPHYFDTYWPENWNWISMISSFEKMENYTYPNGFYGPANNFNYPANFRSNQGLLQVTQTTASNGNYFTEKFIESAKIVWPNIPGGTNFSDNNGYFPCFGVAPAELSMSPAGVRSSPYSSYIETYTGSNLRAIARVRVNRVLFSGTTVTGVELVFLNSSQLANSSTCIVNTNTVVVSSGTVGTPKLLMLSGIGPAAELTRLGIPVVVNAPDVGQHFDDQYGMEIYGVAGTTPLPPGTEYQPFGVAFYNTQDDPTLPGDFCLNMLEFQFGGPPTLIDFMFQLTYSQSKGNVTLVSTDPDVEPLVNPNYLSTLKDKLTMAAGIAQTRALILGMGLDIYADPCDPVSICSTPLGLLDAYLVDNGTPGGHFTGTAAVGKVLDPLTMGVIGTTGLYVMDASALVLSPGGNTQVTTYAVAERGIQLVILDHLSRGVWL
jgi:choline dehydrogenase-like flavoprotein